MFQGLSLDQAPPYKIPLQFYIAGVLYLTIFSMLFAFKGIDIVSRYDYNALALTHLFTLGFFTHIMFGSMFQMIPVMLGLAYKNVVRNANIVFYTLNIATLLFISGLVTQLTPLLHAGGTLLLFAFGYFSFISLKTVLRSENKDFMVKSFATSFFLLGVGAVFGFIALLSHMGIVSKAYFGDLHIAFMLFGWIFLLINAVSYKIIPMFFVAKEFPKLIKNGFFSIILIALLLFGTAHILELFKLSTAILLFLTLIVLIFAIMSITILRTRKRKRKDLSITLWYFAMANIIIAALLFVIGLFYTYPYLDLAIGFFTLFGGVYALINAMLYKIVPFLTWFHLNSNMIFEAEMSQVIVKKDMQRQVSFYYTAYLFFLLIPFFKIATFGAIFFFMLSSLLLFLNLVNAYQYYTNYIE